MASLVDPASSVPAADQAGTTSKSQKKRDQKRRAAERKRAAALADGDRVAAETGADGVTTYSKITAPDAPSTLPDAASAAAAPAAATPQLSTEQIAAMVSAAKQNMAEIAPDASPDEQVKAAMQALQLVTGVLQNRGGDDEVMRQLQAAKKRAAQERKLKDKLKEKREGRYTSSENAPRDGYHFA